MLRMRWREGESRTIPGGDPQGDSWEGNSFLRLVGHLLRRTGTTQSRLPLVWIGGTGSSAMLRALNRQEQLPRGKTEAGDLLDMLKELRVALANHSGGERLWFPRSTLAAWMMDRRLWEEIGDLDSDMRPAAIAARLRGRGRSAQDHQERLQPPEGFVLSALWLLFLYAVPAAFFRAAVSGRFPGIGRPFRWFLSQPYLARNNDSFLSFTERLIATARAGEHSDKIDKLQVHAFLEDLRVAYARRPWAMKGWRRTACPVVMIEGAAPGNPAHRFLELVHEVRRETTEKDPLLVVCAGDAQAPAALTAYLPPQNALPLRDVERTVQRLGPAAFLDYLPLDADGITDAAPTVDLLRIKVPAPPWPARSRTVAVGLSLALLAPLLGWTVGWLGGLDCLHRPFAGQVSVRGIGGNCIGYSDSASFTFNDQPGQKKLVRIQEKIFSHNEQVHDVWLRSGKRRPYVTLVYLGSLTGRPTRANEEAYAAEREELEGLAVAQYQGLQAAATDYTVPLVRIVVANAGFQMKHAATAVGMVEDLARRGGDAPVVGVVGLVESRTTTAAALARLHEAGLPVVAPTLSADDFAENSKLYLQLAAPNRDQSRMVAAYARNVLRVEEARVYYTVGQGSILEEDLYVSTLLNDLKDDLRSLLKAPPKEFASGTDLREVCGYQGMVFFAGRWSEFSSFLRELRKCDGNPPRHLVADDSVNRYIANTTLRKDAPSLPVTYVSKGALATCEALRARVRKGRDQAAHSLLQWIGTDGLLMPTRCQDGSGEPVGERVGLAYDSAMLLLDAVESLAVRVRPDDQPWEPERIDPVAVHTEVLRKHEIQPFSGAAGAVKFSAGGGEPVNKRITLLRVADISKPALPPVEVYRCGIGRVGERPGCGEP